MKRILHLVLMLLVVVSTIGTAEAKSTKKKKAKPVTVDLTNAAGEAQSAPQFDRERKQSDSSSGEVVAKPKPIPFGPPIELQLKRADSRHFDLRSLPRTPPVEQERAELPEPNFHPVTLQSTPGQPEPSIPIGTPTPQAPAPPPINVFEGLDRFNWGAGSPPDTNGDVGPNEFIQTVNTSIGVYRKSDGFQEAAFTFNTFMSQGHFGNLCDTNNFGDPVVLYDTFEDRWIITDFAFLTDISGNVLSPSYQCFAASMTGDPVSGGWNFYSIQISDALNDYPKFGIWPDGLYMSSNMFTFGASSVFKTARAWAFNKAQMYAGSPTVKVVTFDIGGGDFTVIPSNARLQTGTPPPGRPNLFISTELFLNALTVYKFHADWNHISLSTLTGPDAPIASTSWPAANVANAPQPGTTTILDVLQLRAMVQNQYTNFGGTESLWVPHTVRRVNTAGAAAPRWYQTDVTGGTVAAAIPQATTWDPDGNNTNNRFMPSLALDRAGNMAMGYSISNATTLFPSIRYAGRLAADPINTFSQTEQTFFTGTASQTGVTNPPATTRWGDYSAMTLDPDGCTFWITNEYANPADQSSNHRWLTKFGNISPFPGCTPVGAGGTVSGTVTTNPGGAPIAGATVLLGARSATTDGSGNYSFSVPAGMYPSMNASKPGFGSASASSIAVTDGNTTTQNFSLTAAAPSACITDTTQTDFQTGVPSTTVDLNTSPGDVLLSIAPAIDQSNTAGTTTGTGLGTPNWAGQTFIPAVNGLLVRVDVPLFCNGCTGTTPNLTLSLRNTSGGLPTGADLASATFPGFSNGSATTNLSFIFGTPATLTSGTQYALILRPTANPTVGGYFWIRSSPSTYANGSRVTSADSGATWTADTTRDFNFVTYVQTGYAPSGSLTSSPKDSNPSGGITPIWSTFSWNASTPANTSLNFQLAGSNNPNGPFSFVGPDGTAGTFFTASPVQLSPQFYNLRFLEYKAFLATTDPNATPTLNDATACFNDVDCSSTVATVTPTPTAVCSNTTGNTASGPAGMTSYSWGITNGTITSATNTQSITYTAGASGSVTLTLTVTAPNGCIVSGSTPVTINPLPPTPTITPGGPTTVTYPNTVTLNSSSATGNQWYLDTGSGPNPIGGATNQAYIASASGNYTVIVTDANGCVSASSAPTAVVVNPATPVVTATGGTFVYNGTPRPGSGTATGGAGESLTVTLSYVGTGGTTYGPSATAPTLVGTYTVTAHTPGDANNLPGDSSPVALTITMATPVVVATGGTFTYNGNPQAGSGSATGGGGEVLTFTLSYNGTGATTYGPSATAPSLAGTYTVTAHTPGDANNSAGDSSATALTINKFNTLMAAFGGTVTYTGTPHAGSGQALGGAGELLPVTLSYQGISGTVYGPSATAPTNVGVYLVTAHTVGDANNNAEDSLPNALRINKATATIGVTAYCVSFDGSAHTAAGTATGVLSEALTGLVVTGTTHTAAGTYLGDAWSFTNANYSDASGTVDDSIVNAVITAPAAALTGSTGNTASVANAGAGATYVWGITGGTITAGAGTPSITFTAGAVGTLTLNVTVTTSTGCGVAKSANVTVANVAVTSVAPAGGKVTGNSSVTINGTGFESGATVMFGGSAATNVVFVSSIKLTATTPAHAAGQVNVTVTNPDTTTGTLTNGFTYLTMQFDANGDNTVDPSDIFFLVDYLFDHGPAPLGAAGMLSGDANGDGLVDPADIFYVINYLFMGGPVPDATPFPPRVTTSVDQPFRGALSLGEPATRNGRTYVPVILTMAPGSSTPQGIALKLLFGSAANARLQRAGAAANATTSFEVNRPSAKELSYLVAFDQKNGGLSLGSGGARSAVIAEVEVANAESLNIEFDPTVTILSDATGTRTANVASGTLQVTGIESAQRPGTKRPEIN